MEYAAVQQKILEMLRRSAYIMLQTQQSPIAG